MSKKNSHIFRLVIIGSGLIVLGLVAIGIIAYAGSVSSDYSVTPATVNFPAPELTLNNMIGERVSITDYKQQIVLINNWATWCPPCKAEMPTLLKYYQEHVDEGFTLVGINAGDPADQVVKFVGDYKLTFPILLDPNNKSMIVFHNENLPSSYLIDRDGNVVLAWTGPINNTMLEKYVTPHLGQ